MRRNRTFFQITTANLIARSAYQMGKTPLLPIFAASLGASDVYLGIILSVSTLTGMVLKPFIGVLSDRWGRRVWLLAGTLFFAFMPFAYWLVENPTQLFIVRIIHGLATAIYGPVTLAYVSEHWPDRKAERLGWFDTARSAGYILGPALGGALLLSLSPQWIFTLIGFASLTVFLPIAALPEPERLSPARALHPIKTQLKRALSNGSRTPAVWLAGGLEAAVYIATYALKAFLPLFALAEGVNIAVVGLFFAVQEGASMLSKPGGGRLADRAGYKTAVTLGMAVIGAVFPLLPALANPVLLLIAAALIGIGQGMLFPSTTALVSAQIDRENLGAGMGLIGTLRNGGKVAGPFLGGLLIETMGYAATFTLLGLMLFGGALLAGGSAVRQKPIARPALTARPTGDD